MRTPNQFTVKEWQAYLFDAVRRETGAAWGPRPHTIASWTKVLKNLLADGVDCVMLALALDVLALDWSSHTTSSPWELLAPGSLFFEFRRRPRPRAFWRAAWFSRFASTDEEVQFYRYWFVQYDVALSMTRGEDGRAGLLRRSKSALARAEAVLARRGNPRPAFRMHWLRERMGD